MYGVVFFRLLAHKSNLKKRASDYRNWVHTSPLSAEFTKYVKLQSLAALYCDPLLGLGALNKKDIGWV